MFIDRKIPLAFAAGLVLQMAPAFAQTSPYSSAAVLGACTTGAGCTFAIQTAIQQINAAGLTEFERNQALGELAADLADAYVDAPEEVKEQVQEEISEGLEDVAEESTDEEQKDAIEEVAEAVAEDDVEEDDLPDLEPASDA